MITNYYDFYKKTPAEIYMETFNHRNDDEHIAEIVRAEIAAAAKAVEAAKIPDIEPDEEKKKVKVKYVIDEEQIANNLNKALKRIFR